MTHPLPAPRHLTPEGARRLLRMLGAMHERGYRRGLRDGRLDRAGVRTNGESGSPAQMKRDACDLLAEWLDHLARMANEGKS